MLKSDVATRLVTAISFIDRLSNKISKRLKTLFVPRATGKTHQHFFMTSQTKNIYRVIFQALIIYGWGKNIFFLFAKQSGYLNIIFQIVIVRFV